MIEKLLTVLILAATFLLGAWVEREHGVMWRSAILWRRVRAWAAKVASTSRSE